MILYFTRKKAEEVLDGTIIHVIKVDEDDLWKEGRRIHFAVGSRIRDYYWFCGGICKSVQQFRRGKKDIFIDGRKLSYSEVGELAKNNGFACAATIRNLFRIGFKGKIIHWTDKKY